MGNFFTDQYDLYKFVIQGKGESVSKLDRASKAATGENSEQDIKDSCVAISGHNSYDFAFDEVSLLFSILKEKIGVQD